MNEFVKTVMRIVLHSADCQYSTGRGLAANLHDNEMANDEKES